MSTSQNKLIGSSNFSKNTLDHDTYKAYKYHEKIRAKLNEMIARGGNCPVGYEQYLVPWSPQLQSNQSIQSGGNLQSTQSGGKTLKEEDLYKYKAYKYHEKIRAKLNEMIARGEKCPAGYEQYLTEFKL